jgi:NAD(P)-dependent dehydrogenase (short-subunit alcohol dehydrogenase family)
MRVGDKAWVVTGAGSGMGRELVLQMLQRGARVAAVDRDPAGLQDLAASAGAGERLSTHVVDITDRAAVEALPAQVEARHGAVDGLVNNAGIIQPFVPVAEIDDESLQRVLDVNLMGTVHMVRAFLPRLLARPEAHLANVSSMGGFFPFPGQTMYGASTPGSSGPRRRGAAVSR